jgi:hypothetical protein
VRSGRRRRRAASFGSVGAVRVMRRHAATPSALKRSRKTG